MTQSGPQRFPGSAGPVARSHPDDRRSNAGTVADAMHAFNGQAGSINSAADMHVIAFPVPYGLFALLSVRGAVFCQLLFVWTAAAKDFAAHFSRVSVRWGQMADGLSACCG